MSTTKNCSYANYRLAVARRQKSTYTLCGGQNAKRYIRTFDTHTYVGKRWRNGKYQPNDTNVFAFAKPM